jgi:alkanesulfonate monooxygenase SsuD/methylene tetrahydromethanopterin reductase-like flavin-dependent oxidoreductase (luciferase family)
MMNFYAPVLSEAADVPGDTDFRTFDSADELRNSPVGRSAMIGTPGQVAARLRKFTANYNCTHFVMVTQLPGMPPRDANRSLELFAREVLPQFRES